MHSESPVIVSLHMQVDRLKNPIAIDDQDLHQELGGIWRKIVSDLSNIIASIVKWLQMEATSWAKSSIFKFLAALVGVSDTVVLYVLTIFKELPTFQK